MKKLILKNNYSREDIHSIFAPETSFTPGSGTWGNHGIIPIPDREDDFVFIVTYGQSQEGMILMKESQMMEFYHGSRNQDIPLRING